VEILLLYGQGGQAPAPLRAALEARGHRVAVRAGGGLRPRSASPDAVISSGSLPGAHLEAAAFRRRGVPWAMLAGDDLTGPGFAQRRLELRLVRAADVVLCDSDELVAQLHERVGANLARIDFADSDGGLDAALLALERSAPAQGADPNRVLMLGPVNSPHVEHMTLALRELGVDVHVAGDVWPGMPPSVLAAEGVPVSVVRPPFATWLRSVVRRVRPAVVHAHWTPFAFKALTVHARPLVVTPWGSDVYNATGRFALANRPIARFSDKIVTDSQNLLDAMAALGAPRERLVLLNWGVDLERFKPAEDRAEVKRRLGLEPGPVVLSPRTLRDLYNPKVIIAAFRQIEAEFPGAQLVLKHMGTDEPDLGPLPDRTRVIGHVPYEQMADWYAAADACVSIASSDSSPRSVWEAMACGAPCVLSDLPWVHETIEPGTQALVVKIDADEVAGALRTLLGEPERAQAIGRAARELVERERDQRKEMQRLMQIYSELARG
jgi:glycosyltransferase involved in cell wall biosynthesis